MRGFIYLAESCLTTENDSPEIIEEVPQENLSVIINDLKDVVLKLRSYMENDTNNDYALGVESGMQKAADMIERVIRTHGESSNG